MSKTKEDNLIGEQIGIYIILSESEEKTKDGHKKYNVKCTICKKEFCFPLSTIKRTKVCKHAIDYPDRYCLQCGRLIERKTESKEKILNRFKTAYQEINQVSNYNYVVTNDTVANAVEKISSILISEKCRVDRITELYLGNEEEEIHELLMEQKFINKNIKL